MNRPNDTSLPFFSYGIFKPGQLCYFRIESFVENVTKCEVPGILKERDGMPLLVLGNSYFNIKGYLIHFIAGEKDAAYDQIIGIEPGKVYRWETVKVNNSDANVLVGKK